jgi:hypothetical protein
MDVVIANSPQIQVDQHGKKILMLKTWSRIAFVPFLKQKSFDSRTCFKLESNHLIGRMRLRTSTQLLFLDALNKFSAALFGHDLERTAQRNSGY